MGEPTRDQLIEVNLTSERVDRNQIPDHWLDRYLGGKGLGARYLYDAVDPTIEPLDPENELLFLLGPLSGVIPGDPRVAVVTKSPLTGLFLDSYMGGSFVPAFRERFSRCLGLRIHGRADELSVLDLRNGTAQLKRTPSLSGVTIDECEDHFPESTVIGIGPAGESTVRFATIGSDGGDHHAGRGGTGAVFGSKKLKAVLLPAAAATSSDDPTIEHLSHRARERYQDSPEGTAYRSAGTLDTVPAADTLGMLPSHGWTDRSFDGALSLGYDAINAQATERERADEAIPGDYRMTTESGETTIRGGTPVALGATLGIEDVNLMAELGTACDRLGLDVISTGNALALAIHASNAGKLDRDLGFGDANELQPLVEEIAHRSSALGELLAGGVAAAATELGLSEVIPTIKSMAVPSFDPRGAPAMALAYATSDRGPCHRRAVPATQAAFHTAWTADQTAKAVIVEQNHRAMQWALVLDDVTASMVEPDLPEWLAATGQPLQRDDLEEIGERIWTVTRLYNVREGCTRAADSLPQRFSQPNDRDDAVVDVSWFERARSRYYQRREWDPAGIPSERLLVRLGLDTLVDSKTPIGGHPLGH